MLARRFFFLLLAAAVAFFCPGCACAPDRWTATYKRSRDLRRDRPNQDEVDVSLSGPIPFFHD